jgi:hypothetical protein
LKLNAQDPDASVPKQPSDSWLLKTPPRTALRQDDGQLGGNPVPEITACPDWGCWITRVAWPAALVGDKPPRNTKTTSGTNAIRWLGVVMPASLSFDGHRRLKSRPVIRRTQPNV